MVKRTRPPEVGRVLDDSGNRRRRGGLPDVDVDVEVDFFTVLDP